MTVSVARVAEAVRERERRSGTEQQASGRPHANARASGGQTLPSAAGSAAAAAAHPAGAAVQASWVAGRAGSACNHLIAFAGCTDGSE